MSIENNAYFWQKLDTMIMSGNYQKKYNKNEAHHKYPALVYPLDFGYIVSELGDFKTACYKGSNGSDCNSIIVSVDILEGSSVVQLLIGVSEQEQNDLLLFLNQTQFQKTILISRSNVIPTWAMEN